MAPIRAIAGIGLLAAYLRASGLRRRRDRRSLEQRLDDLPGRGVPLRHRVEIHWNRHHVPFIEAQCDDDLPVALGVVHAHLRLAQMELMRRLARGRLAEILGPAAFPVDHALRILDLGRAVPTIAAALPDDTRAWLQGFADGINHAIAETRRLPEEFAVLGVRPRPWTVHDLLALSRLAAVDFTWRVWIRLLRLRGRPDWADVWQRMVREEAIPVPSFAGSGVPAAAALDWALGAFGRCGSNSVAVARDRSATGSALLASDPHLSIALPNLWLICGCRSPGYHAVGLMIPGVPVVAIGRNPWIGWGGTSLHAASSELFDVSDIPDGEIVERRETIRVRWWGDRAITARETAFGPVISDAPFLHVAPGERWALHWIGHTPSDETTALLRANRARNWQDFQDALDGFAVPGLTMVFADAEGRIGRLMAAKLPRRPSGAPADMIAGREFRRHWERFVTAKDLPSGLGAPGGIIASANDRPEPTAVPVGFFFSPADRVQRIRTLLGRDDRITVEALAAMQRDVLMPSALAMRDLLLQTADGMAGPGRDAGGRRARVLEALRQWDGRYDPDSVGGLALELVLYHFVRALKGSADVALYGAALEPWALLREEIEAHPPKRVAATLDAALARAADGVARFQSWGAVHRLRLAHVFAAVPLTGRRYRFADVAVGGSNETVMKTAHGFSAGRHTVRFGANARHISDFADPDKNFFVLLGGQDGWLGSATSLDQFALWRRGAYVQLPLRPETVRRSFPHKTVLAP